MTPDETERLERLEEAMTRILHWAEAYPLDIFPEADADYLNRAHAALKAKGMSLDRISASSMRHVVTSIGHIAREALDPCPQLHAAGDTYLDITTGKTWVWNADTGRWT